jgi:signal transduction histidine kinase
MLFAEGYVRLPSKTITVPLTLAFAVLLVLIVTATAITLTKSFAIFELLAQTHDAHNDVAEALQHLRSDLYLGGILKRDFLLDRNAQEAASYGEQFAAIQASADQNLAIIERSLGRQQPQTVRQLRSEVTAYMRPLKEALDWDPIAAPALRSFLLRAQLTQRSAALQMAGEIENLNRDLLRVQKDRIRSAEREFRRTLLIISFATAAMGITVALFTTMYTRRLERNAEEVRVELKRLSQHVVRAQEIERRNISRELHDEVGQMLTGLRMELANLDVPAIQQNTTDYHRLQEAKRLTERTLQCVRNLSMLLRPSMLDDLGLSPALRWQAKEFSRRSSVPVNVTIDGDVDAVPEDVRTCVYRVAQEALTNAIRHADAHRINLVVRREGEQISVSIQDDGKGFDLSKSPRNAGIGLIGLKERVSELSGTTRIRTEPGKGTHISVQLPVPAEGVPS